MFLERKFNLVFLKYKKLSFYSSLTILVKIPISPAGILIYPTIKRKLRRSFKRSRKYLKLRSNSEEV